MTTLANSTTYHNPVMLQQAIKGLNIKPSGVYVDVTFGGGGHSRAILNQLDEAGRLVAFDQDKDAADNQIDDTRFQFVQHNFKYLKNFIRSLGYEKVDGILADLGVSSAQFDTAEKGFSFRFDAPLDMRMNNSDKTTAADVLNTYSEENLKTIFFQYGEINNAGKLAHKIVELRTDKPFENSKELVEVLEDFAPTHREYKYFAQVFQALRIEVNKELEALKALLMQANEILNQSGRMVVISYHSLEDRLVKHFFKSGNFEGKIEKDFYGKSLVPFKMITRKPLMPAEEEVNNNLRARSAKLRIVEKI